MTSGAASYLANVPNLINVLAMFNLVLFTQEFAQREHCATKKEKEKLLNRLASIQLDDGKPQRC